VPEILKRCPAKQLMALYKVPAFKDADEFLQHVAFQRGRLLPGGIGDSKSAARVVLHDWHNGKIAYYTMPPRRGDGSHEEAAIVQAWGEAFSAERVSPLPPQPIPSLAILSAPCLRSRSWVDWLNRASPLHSLHTIVEKSSTKVLHIRPTAPNKTSLRCKPAAQHLVAIRRRTVRCSVYQAERTFAGLCQRVQRRDRRPVVFGG